MKNDIQLNMSQLADIYETISAFYKRAEQLHETSIKFYEAIMNQTTTELYELAEDWNSHVIPREQQLLARLEKASELLLGYIGEMGSCITPVDATKMMRVDKADIWFNLEQIRMELCNFIYSPTSMICQFITWDNEEIDETETDPKKLNFFEEAKKKRQRNYEKLSNFQLNFRLNAEIYMESELFRVYNESIVPYEEIDNEYSGLAEEEYRAYVTTHDSGTDFERGAGQLFEGFIDGALETLDGLYTLALATDILPREYVPFIFRADADRRVQEFRLGVLESCLDPVGTLEAIGQGVADTYEEEGLNYMIGGLLFEVVFDYIVCKGATKLSKLNDVGKLGKTTNFIDEVAEATKPVEDLLDVFRKSERNAQTNYNILNTSSADEVNTIFQETMGYEPPYKPGTTVSEIQLTENATYVRVYDKINSRMQGGWVMKSEDIIGLTPQEIQNKFALPTTPKYVCDVNLEAGTRLRMGEVNPLFGFEGGGQQYDLIINGKNVGIFTNERIIGQ